MTVDPERAGDRLGSLLIKVGAAMLVLVLLGWAGLWWSQRDDRAADRAAKAQAAGVAQATAAAKAHIQRWSRQSAEARAIPDPEKLNGLYLPGSKLEQVDKQTIEALRRDHLRVDLTNRVRVILVESASPDQVVARVTWSDDWFVIHATPSGKVVNKGQGDLWVTRMTLVRRGSGWRIADNLTLSRRTLEGLEPPPTSTTDAP